MNFLQDLATSPFQESIHSTSCSPFLLPCALTACFGALTATINLLYMKETLPSLKERLQQRHSSSEDKVENKEKQGFETLKFSS